MSIKEELIPHFHAFSINPRILTSCMTCFRYLDVGSYRRMHSDRIVVSTWDSRPHPSSKIHQANHKNQRQVDWFCLLKPS